MCNFLDVLRKPWKSPGEVKGICLLFLSKMWKLLTNQVVYIKMTLDEINEKNLGDFSELF